MPPKVSEDNLVPNVGDAARGLEIEIKLLSPLMTTYSWYHRLKVFAILMSAWRFHHDCHSHHRCHHHHLCHFDVDMEIPRVTIIIVIVTITI